jgi:glycosyltransferase involved in cell wall biosynthesis
MRILILSQYCSPEPDLKKVPFAIKLKEFGHEVEILTGYPNYPTGKIFEGYSNKWVTREKIKGIDIIRVPLYPSQSKSAIKRVWNYLSFALSASFFGLFYIKKPQVIYAYHAPATIAIPAILFKLIFRCKILYDINDYWPDSLEYSGMLRNKKILNLIASYCKLTYRFFDKITVVSSGYIQKLKDDGVPESKISLIYNWPHPYGLKISAAFLENKHLFENCISILYAGNIGSAQGLEIILDAAEHVQNTSKKQVRFILIGNGNEKINLYNQVKSKNIDNIFFIDTVPLEELGNFLKLSCILLMHLKSNPLFEITIPSKLYTYFCVGKPILSGVTGEANKMVENSKAGIVFRSDDKDSFINALDNMLSLSTQHLEIMGNNGHEFFEKNFSIEIGTKKFNEILKSLIP